MESKLCQCGKVGEISCPNDERCGNKQSELSTLKAQQGGAIRENIENILFKSGKLYQEECTWLADIILQECPNTYQELKERYDNIAKEHSDLNLALAAMLNGYQNLSAYQKGWFTVSKDLIEVYTKMVLEYDNPGNCKGQKEGDGVEFAEWCANNYQWEYDPTSDEYRWLEANNFYTTAELYAIFKQQKEK